MKNKIQKLNRSFFIDLNNQTLMGLQILLVLAFCLLPLMLNLPYRANLYVTWEGAYRLYLGQVPYKDFGLPLGIGFWITPYIFFKIFGPTFGSLIKAQVFLNFISLLTIRVIFRKLGLSEALIFLILLINCLSFVILNFWPWYNHTVFVFQLVSITFSILLLFEGRNWRKYFYTVAAGFFAVLAFYTKQDGGGFAIISSGVLVLIGALVYDKKGIFLIIYSFSTTLFLVIYITLFTGYDFGYWFNYGQEPHYSRVNVWDILNQFFGDSIWIKFYIGVVVLVIIKVLFDRNWLVFSKEFVLQSILTLLILGQVIIIQITSFSPPYGVYYYHTFGIAFLLSRFKMPYSKLVPFILVSVLMIICYSNNYWKYSSRFLSKMLPASIVEKNAGNVSIGNWASADITKKKTIRWVETDMQVLDNVTLPEECYWGIKGIRQLDIVKTKGSDLKVLNMSEVTFLAHELGYTPYERQGMPLWYHRGICVFDREIRFLCELIEEKEFDLILFQKMNYVADYFPFQVRDCALKNYQVIDEFISPTGYGNDGSPIEVFVRNE